MLDAGKKLAVFSIVEGKNGSIWVRAGRAEVNEDGSLDMDLEALPRDGKLHVRELAERRPDAAALH